MYRDQFGEFVCGYIRGTKQKPYMDSCTPPCRPYKRWSCDNNFKRRFELRDPQHLHIPLKLEIQKIFTCYVKVFSLKLKFSARKISILMQSFLQNQNWDECVTLIATLKNFWDLRLYLLISASNKEFFYFSSKKIFCNRNRKPFAVFA